MIAIERRMKSILDNLEFSKGDDELLQNIKRFRDSNVYDNKLSMTGSAQMDRILEQVLFIDITSFSNSSSLLPDESTIPISIFQLLEFVMRDFVDPWYKQMTDDKTFRLSLMRTMRRSVFALSKWYDHIYLDTLFYT